MSAHTATCVSERHHTSHHLLWQDVYHAAVDDIDIAIIWPQDDGHLETYFKPVTRLVYWWSHGVPVIFYPTQVRLLPPPYPSKHAPHHSHTTHP